MSTRVKRSEREANQPRPHGTKVKNRVKLYAFITRTGQLHKSGSCLHKIQYITSIVVRTEYKE